MTGCACQLGSTYSHKRICDSEHLRKSSRACESLCLPSDALWGRGTCGYSPGLLFASCSDWKPVWAYPRPTVLTPVLLCSPALLCFTPALLCFTPALLCFTPTLLCSLLPYCAYSYPTVFFRCSKDLTKTLSLSTRPPPQQYAGSRWTLEGRRNI